MRMWRLFIIAITAMVELSKDYDSKLQTFERTYAAAPGGSGCTG